MLSKELENTLNETFRTARARRHEFITVEHLLLALLDDSAAVAVLDACQVDLDDLRGELTEFIDSTTPLLSESDDGRDTQPTLGFQRVLQRAVFHVQSSGKKEVTGANVLVAIFSEQESQAVYVLKKQSIARIDVVNFVSHGISRVQGAEDQESHDQASHEEAGEEGGQSKPLESYATNLNEQARQGRIDPLIGREHEVERVVQILVRRRKNNPLLVGEAGVGKTAIAEGLAKRIVDGQVPDIISDAVVYSLDLGALLGGDSRLAGCFGNETRFVDIARDGFLTIDMFLLAQGGQDGEGVRVFGGAHHHGIVVAGIVVEFAEVVIGCSLGKCRGSPAQVAVVDVYEGHNVFTLAYRAHVVSSTAPTADYCYIQLGVRGPRADNGRKSEGSGSGSSLQEAAAGRFGRWEWAVHG